MTELTRKVLSGIALAFSSLLIINITLAEKEPMKPMDLFDLEYVTDPQISPHGKYIAYVRHFSDIKTDRRYANIWLINSDGSGHHPVTSGHQGDFSPRWSSDGKRLAYISTRDGTAQIYIRWMETGETTRVTNLKNPPGGPVWSPDGRAIAFTCFVNEPPKVYGKMPSPPEGAKWADPPVVVDRYKYRYDGVGYLKSGYIHLFVIPADGGTPRQISSGKFHHGAPWVPASQAMWTPDGKHILMSTNRHPDYEFDPLNTEIYEFDVESGAVRAFTSRHGPDSHPVISPDGKLIAYIGFDDKYISYQTNRLHVMNRDRSGVRILSSELVRSVMFPQWTPDGKGILCLYTDHGNTKIAHFALDGTMTDVTKNVGTGGMAFPYGISFSVAQNGAVAFPVTTFDIPGDVAVTSLSSTEARVVTAVNQDLLSRRNLGEVEEVWFASSRDGRKIHGWIIKPPDFDSQKKYPLILEIHGGPLASYGDRFSASLQIMAAHGYVVLYTNPRGSTSYEAEFANLIHLA